MRLYPIPKFEGYFIGLNSDVYSFKPRQNVKNRVATWKKLSPYTSMGYWVIDLTTNGKRIKKYVHELMLITFKQERPFKGAVCRHLNGNRKDNRIQNLTWGTHTENMGDRNLHGTDNRGEKHGMHKLTVEKVLAIRELAKSFNKKTRAIDRGGNYKTLAKMFGIAPSTVGSVARGHTWRWVK